MMDGEGIVRGYPGWVRLESLGKYCLGMDHRL